MNWVLIVYDKDVQAYDWVATSDNRLSLVERKMDMYDRGYQLAGMFINRFDHKPTMVEIALLISSLNRLNEVLLRYGI